MSFTKLYAKNNSYGILTSDSSSYVEVEVPNTLPDDVSSGNFRVLIGDELLNVSNVSFPSGSIKRLTVDRGVEGTAYSDHDSTGEVLVKHVFTADIVNNMNVELEKLTTGIQSFGNIIADSVVVTGDVTCLDLRLDDCTTYAGTSHKSLIHSTTGLFIGSNLKPNSYSFLNLEESRNLSLTGNAGKYLKTDSTGGFVLYDVDTDYVQILEEGAATGSILYWNSTEWVSHPSLRIDTTSFFTDDLDSLGTDTYKWGDLYTNKIHTDNLDLNKYFLSGTLSFNFNSITTHSATLDVTDKTLFSFSYTSGGTQDITGLSGGVENQIVIIVGRTSTNIPRFIDNTNLKLVANRTMILNSTLVLLCIDSLNQYYIELSYSDNS